jgi:hypothetical protein
MNDGTWLTFFEMFSMKRCELNQNVWVGYKPSNRVDAMTRPQTSTHSMISAISKTTTDQHSFHDQRH